METSLSETYALHEGEFGRVVVLELTEDLVAHAHAETQFAFWLGGGRVQARLASEIVDYSEDVALGTNAYESHDARLLDKSQPAFFLVLYISKNWLDAKRASSGRPFYFATPRVPLNLSLRQACWRVLDTIISLHHDVPSKLETEVESLIDSAIDSAMAPTDHIARGSRPPMLDHRLRAAIAYMRQHVGEPISVDEMAGKVGLSRAHFFSLFRDQLHTTPQVCWSAVRVEEVLRRLVSREEPLTSVALELGFSSPGNFSRFFKEHMGVSPSKFRRVAAGPQRHPITGVD